jgi:Domain of unknown function (DUF5919)
MDEPHASSERILKEAILGILIAVLAGAVYAVVEKTTRHEMYAIAVSLLVAFALAAGWVCVYIRSLHAAHARELGLIGIRKIFPRFADAPATHEIIAKARISVKYLGISGRTFFESDDAENLIREKIRSGVSFQFLFMDPASAHVASKARAEGDDPEAWKHDIRASMARVNRVRSEPGAETGVEMKTYDAMPLWRLLFVDDQAAYVTYYPRGFRGKHCPIFEVESKDISFYDPLHDFFRYLWAGAAEVPAASAVEQGARS